MLIKGIGIRKVYITVLVFVTVQIMPLSAGIGQVSSAAKLWSESGLPFIRNYNSKEYGGFIQNWSVLQDHRSFIYVANNHGLLEYDGVSWRLYDDDGKLNAIRSLAIDSSGVLYVGTATDFGYLAPDSLQGLKLVSLLPKVDKVYHEFNDIWSTLILNDVVYFMAPQYLFRWSGGQVEVLHPKTQFHTAFVVGQNLYVRQMEIGLTTLIGDSLRLIPGGELFSDKRIYFMARRDDAVLIGTDQDGFFLYDGQISRPFPTSADEQLKESKLYCGVQLDGGYYALGTRRGGLIIMAHSGKVVQRISTSNGLNDDSVWFVHQDYQGGLWLALNNGIARVETPAPFTVFNKENGLEGTVEKAYRHNNTLYVATSVGIQYLSIDRNDGIPSARFQPVSGIDEYSWVFLTIGNQLLAGSAVGIHLIEQNTSKKIQSPLSSVFSLIQSQQHEGRIYVGHRNGVSILEKRSGRWGISGDFAHFSEKVYHIIEENPGVLWFETDKNGVARAQIRESDRSISEDITAQIVHFDTSDGLPDGYMHPIMLGGEVRFGNEKGIWRFNTQLEQFFPDSSINLSGHWDFLGVEDVRGYLWSSRSDSYGNPVQIGYCIPGEDGSYRWHPEHFLRLQGIAYVNHIYPEQNGVAWFSTSEALIRYTPTLQKNTRQQYGSFIRHVVVNEDSTIFRGHGDLLNPTLRYIDNTIRIEFAAPAFDAGSETKYQTQLIGFKEQWSNWGYETKKDYTNLFEGDYVFKARAQNIYGQMSSEAIFPFAVRPPWYRSVWAYIAYSFIFVVGLLATDRLRRSQLIKKEREKAQLREAKLRAEAAELRTEKAELLANHMQAEAERRAKELERARELQLSMLPDDVPSLPQIEIAAYMKTATEVGGDYYDFFQADDGTLIVVLGDATGHGLDAGMIVTATKSILQTIVYEPEVSEMINKTNIILKDMHLRGLYMSLLILRIKAYESSCCVAGMPPILVYRASTQKVEEVTIKAPPLGAFENIEYEERKIKFSSGDVLVLMSDGFPERFNEEKEMLGYDKAKSAVTDIAHCSSEEIIEHFVDIGDAWAGNFPQNDDITFVVLKFK